MTAPRTLADVLDDDHKKAHRFIGFPTDEPSAKATVPDSVSVSLFGEKESPEARRRYMARVAEVAHALVSGGPKAVSDMPPPKTLMRATTPKERSQKP